MKEAEVVNKIKGLKEKIAETWKLLDLDQAKIQIKGLEIETSQPDFWVDQEKAKEVSQKLAETQEEVNNWESLKREVDDLLEIASLDKIDKEVDLRQEAEDKLAELEKKFAELEFFVLFDQPYDKENAVLAIHAGAGGVDAQDWTEMLLRMIARFCEGQGFKVNMLDQSKGGEAGIKSVFLEIIGRYAYGYLKSENGVHRLVRISPFDAEKMRHTSFALIEVIPELEEVKEVELNEEDLRIDVFKSSGKGGQGVNTTDSAVRITHLPTGITVSCQNERSQHQNKETAVKVLKSKLHQYYQTEAEEEKQRLRGEFTEAAWGNQIRSYVLHPYKMVKDHRTDYETSDVDSVLDGELQTFIEEYLKWLKK